VAGELILRRAERLRGTGTERSIGSIAGFQLLVADNCVQGPDIVLQGAATHVAKVGDTALGTIRSVEYALQHLEDVAATLEQTLRDSRKRLTDAATQADAPFDYADRLPVLIRRQQEIAEALDLHKNQPAVPSDSTPTESPEAVNLPV
jgi:hypothetical protein